MLVYHVTRRAVLASIQREGICVRYATGARKAVWVVGAGRRVWALAHCSARHRVPVSDLVVLRCRVGNDAHRKHGGVIRTVGYSVVDIAPGAILDVVDGATLVPSVE